MGKNKVNVLVFSGATYPAMQIINSLKHTVRYHVIAVSGYPNHSEFVCDDTIHDMPFIFADDFFDKFISFIVERNIQYIIPTDDTIALTLMEHQQDIPAVIVCSPLETARLCRYKKKAYKYLQGKFYTPKIFDSPYNISPEDYPVFIKPDSGQGGRGAKLICNAAELAQVENLDSYAICEYLSGEEYTVDCFTNRDRQLVFCNPRVRTRLMNGITAHGNNVPLTEEFSAIINSLNNEVVFRGYWFAQLKRDASGNLKLLEICTRFAGSFAISKGKGINLPLLALSDFADLPAEPLCNSYNVECDKTYIDRYSLDLKYTTVYIDYDDTVTMQDGEKINPYVLAYLYQCKNKNKKIILLTRHADTFKESLTDSFTHFSLSPSLFDEIIELSWDEKKADVIKENDCIFIDNSFAERKSVQIKTGIPVFDVCDIECLFDWRE